VLRSTWYSGKSAISIARRFAGKTKNFTGEILGARKYFVTTIGWDEGMVSYFRNQDKEYVHYDQLKLGI
jgi:putative transposase